MPKKPRQERYILRRSPQDLDREFYRLYDADFLFTKAVTLAHAAKNPDHLDELRTEWETAGVETGDRFLAALGAEIYFTELHQFEAFFALAEALFQDVPHWIYLNRYRTEEIIQAAGHFVDGDVASITGGRIDTREEFVSQAIYSGLSPTDPELAARWPENLDAVVWIIERVARRYLEGKHEYNGYKHGLRVLAASHSLAVGLEREPGGPVERWVDHFSSPDALTYLELKDVGEGGQTVYTKTRHFNPDASLYYLSLMRNLAQTIRDTRVAHLEGRAEGTRLNTFFGLDRDHVRELEMVRAFEVSFTW